MCTEERRSARRVRESVSYRERERANAEHRKKKGNKKELVRALASVCVGGAAAREPKYGVGFLFRVSPGYRDVHVVSEFLAVSRVFARASASSKKHSRSQRIRESTESSRKDEKINK